MKRPYSQLVFIALVAISQNSFALTLQEAIKVSLENNPKTIANELRVKAQEDRLNAQKLNWYPKLTLSSGYDVSKSTYSSESRSSDSSGRSARVGINTSLTLYDGGSTTYSIQAAAADLKATEARYSSSNALIPNTRGSIAKLVKDAYVSLIQISEQKKYLNSLGETLQIFLIAAKTEDQISLVKQGISDLKTSMTDLEASYLAALNDFKYFSTIPAPTTMQTFEEAIASLTIPRSADEAFQIALQKSPNIKLAEYELESARLKYKAGKADSYAPRVTLSSSVQRGSSANDGSSSQNSSASVGINIRYTLDAASSYRDAAAEKTMEASQRDKDGAIDQVRYEIDTVYPHLKNQQEIYLLQLANLRTTEETLRQFAAKIKSGQTVDLNFGVINILEPLRQYRQACLKLKTDILNTRFNIQRSVGTLFDSVGLSTTREGFSK